MGHDEIGPITINAVFDSIESIEKVKESSEYLIAKYPPSFTILGNNYYCDWDIIKGELHVKGLFAYMKVGLQQMTWLQ